jgi:RelA/SpoT family (p)ppGpp synthetase
MSRAPWDPGRTVKAVINQHPRIVELSLRLDEALADRPARTSLVADAVDLAVRSHDGQLRKSGEPYVCHPLSVAITIAELGLDDASVAAAICHDVVEDCDVDLDHLTALLGAEVATLVDGVTKVRRVLYTSDEAAAEASTMKLLIALSNDVRVLLIKLADRWHNMSTLSALPEAKRRRIANETLETYAPLAHRLGLDDLARDLEDLCFEHLYPAQYHALSSEISSLAPRRDHQLHTVTAALSRALADRGIRAEMVSRTKGLWSTYEKMTQRQKSLESMNDLLGLRVVVRTRAECYAVLGVVHELWVPKPDSFTDYIAAPKANGYQSLHTAVTARDLALEVQIRTEAMDDQAKRGVAAHFAYKARTRGLDPALAWTADLSDTLTFLTTTRGELTAGQFFKELRQELVDDELYLFTPKGALITLPAGACALDFAYAIHTGLGSRAVGARVNGALAGLTEPLHTGDTVEVLTSPGALPRREWAAAVVTAKAKTGLRRIFTKLTDDQLRALGRTQLISALLEARHSPVLEGPIGASLVQTAKVDSLDELCLRAGLDPDQVRHWVEQLPSEGDVVAPGGPSPTIAAPDGQQLIALTVTSLDRTGLLKDCTEVLFDLGVSIESTRTGVGPDRLSHARYVFFLADGAHLDAIVAQISSVPSVVDVAVEGSGLNTALGT